MKTHTVIDGNAFYEIDDKCYEELMRKKERMEKGKERLSETPAAQKVPEVEDPEMKSNM